MMFNKKKKQLALLEGMNEEGEEKGEKRESQLEKKKRRQQGRWSVLLLFLVTIVASGAVYLRSNWGDWWRSWELGGWDYLWQGWFMKEEAGLSRKWFELVGGKQGKYGGGVVFLKKGKKVSWEEGELFPNSSLKGWFLGAGFYRLADLGAVDLEKKIIWNSSEDWWLGKEGGEGEISLRELVRLMLVYGSRQAADLVEVQVEEEEWDQLMEEMGLREENWRVDLVTPGEALEFLSRFYEGKILSREKQIELEGFLAESTFSNGLAKNWQGQVAFQAGMEMGSFGEGLLALEGEPRVAVLLAKNALQSEVRVVFSEMGRLLNN